jgi:gliding motility-associated-like protein
MSSSLNIFSTLKKLISIFFLACLYSIHLCHSQGETKIWYFGNQAGLDFNTNQPTIITNNAIPSGYASTAVISDVAGNLLFYTNGLSVWDRTHSIMANGSGLIGVNHGGLQNVLIIKKPGTGNIYYIFHAQWSTSVISGLYYSEVNMSLAAGNGSVVSKNLALVPPSAGILFGNLTATKHCNGIDIWLTSRDTEFNTSIGGPITTQTINNSFRSFLLTSVGINTNAIISTPITYTSNAGTNQFGGIKISPNGKKIVATSAINNTNNVNYQRQFELFDFDNTTGVVSNSFVLMNNTFSPYYYPWSLEFSPDGSKLYASHSSNNNSTGGQIFQWDLCAGSNTAIAASVYTVHSSPSTDFTSIQQAPNGKLYIARSISTLQALDVIHNPNAAGSACNYSFAGQSIAPQFNFYGLPNFMSSYFSQPPPATPFTHTVSNLYGCQTVSFNSVYSANMLVGACAQSSYSLTNILWNFGDLASGINNTSSLSNPSHAYSALGTYTAQLILYYSCGGGTDTIKQVVQVNQPCLTFNSNSITCATLGTSTVQAFGGIGPYTYTWMPSNQTNSVATGLSPGTYTVSVFDTGANYSYTATTTFSSPVALTGQLNNSNSITCHGASTGTANYTNLAGGSGTQHYLWSNGLNTFTISQPNTLSAGLWSVTVTDALTGCQINDVFFISQPPATTLQLSSSSATSCVGANIVLTGTNSGGIAPYTYSWTAGSASQTHTVSATAGLHIYTLQSYDANNCLANNTIAVTFIAKPTLSLTSTSICPLETGTLHVSGATNYTWSNLSTSSSITDTPLTSTNYTVIGQANTCTNQAVAAIIVKASPNPIITSNSPLCENSAIHFSVNTGTAFVWAGPNAFSSTTKTNVINPASINHTGVYQVTVTAANSCTASIQATLIVKPLPNFTLSQSSASICLNTNGSSSQLTAMGTATQFNWQPSQGLSNHQQASVNATPSVTTTYSLTGTLNGCSLTQNITVHVVNPPNLGVTLSSPSTCAQALNGSPNTIIISGSGASTYTLITPSEFNNPNPAGPQSPISLAPPYHNTGPSTATLYGGNGVCTVSATAQFTIVPNPTISVSNPTPIICAGDTYTYTNAGANSYTWTSSTPNTTLYTTGHVTVAHPSISSVFSIVGGSLGCNSAIESSSITVKSLPNLTVSPSATAICLGTSQKIQAHGDADDFTWHPSTWLNNHQQATVQATPPQQQTYTVIASLNGCNKTAVSTISVLALPTPSISNLTPSLCVNETIRLQAAGGLSYRWQSPNQLTINQQALLLKVEGANYAGDYTLTAIDNNNCENSTTTKVHVYALPQGYLVSQPPQGCAPLLAELQLNETHNNSAITQVDWRMTQPKEQALNTQKAFTHQFTQAGHYTIVGTLKDANQCVNTITTHIEVYPKPLADFTYYPEKPVEGVDDVVFNNTSKGAKEFTWFLQHQNNAQGEQEWSQMEHPVYRFNEPGIYPIILQASNQWLCSDTLIKTIKVEADFNVYIPNTFTPNEDGNNEYFLPITRGVKLYELMIFNRWGKKLFETNDPTKGWDGTYQGQACKQEVYIWKLIVSANNGQQKQLTGEVLLVR